MAQTKQTRKDRRTLRNLTPDKIKKKMQPSAAARIIRAAAAASPQAQGINLAEKSLREATKKKKKKK